MTKAKNRSDNEHRLLRNAYYARNKERIQAKRRAKIAESPEKKRARERAYRKANPQKFKNANLKKKTA